MMVRLPVRAVKRNRGEFGIFGQECQSDQTHNAAAHPSRKFGHGIKRRLRIPTAKPPLRGHFPARLEPRAGAEQKHRVFSRTLPLPESILLESANHEVRNELKRQPAEGGVSAKTIALDPKTHRLDLLVATPEPPAADAPMPAPTRGRRRYLPGSFVVVVVGE